jgi:hypothetical protein
MARRRRWAFLASAVVFLSGCELFWSWSGVGSAGGASPCGSRTAILCDDFEHDDVNNPWQPLTTAGGTASIDTAHATSGTHALHARAVGAGGSPGIGAQWTRGVSLPDRAYLRMMVYGTSPLAAWQDFGSFGDTSGTFLALWMGTGDPDNALGWADNADPANPTVSLATSFAGADAWSCVELEIDRGQNAVRVWVNGAESTDLQRSSVVLPAVSVLDIGEYVIFPMNSPSMTYDVWIDDVVVDTQYVDCVP